MELQQFVTETLIQIVEGVQDAKADVRSAGGEINPELMSAGKDQMVSTSNRMVQLVDFDVAVTVSEGTGTKGGGGIFVGAFGLGAQGESTAASSSVSRIKFQVPISLPHPS